MIKLSKKTDCCGCTACEHSCPKHCISMKSDAEGFLYPSVDLEVCIDCGKCERVCPVANQYAPNIPEYCIAAINNNEETRFHSSSGGMFSLLAEKIINSGGIVFGVIFDEKWDVIHSSAESLEQLTHMRGSKYIQSALGDTYLKVKCELLKGRPVMFTGTQCQVSGLNHFLGKSYSNLVTIEIICHGVPSPATWQSYRPVLKHSFRFRDKRNGWTASCISYDSKFISHLEDTFMQSFFCKLNIRPSCYACPAKNGRSGADITLGDFWGIQNIAPEFYDNKGTSLVIVHTQKGQALIDSLDFKRISLPYDKGLAGNPSLSHSVEPDINRDFFFQQFKKYGFASAWERTISSNVINRVRRKLYRMIHSAPNFNIN